MVSLLGGGGNFWLNLFANEDKIWMQYDKLAHFSPNGILKKIKIQQKEELQMKNFSETLFQKNADKIKKCYFNYIFLV